jgi:hypothetical protein
MDYIVTEREPCSSVNTVTGYGLGGRKSNPGRGGGFFIHPLGPTGSEAHPAPVQWVLGVPFPRVTRGRGVMLSTHPFLVPRLRKRGAIRPLHPKRLLAYSAVVMMNWNLKNCNMDCGKNTSGLKTGANGRIISKVMQENSAPSMKFYRTIHY